MCLGGGGSVLFFPIKHQICACCFKEPDKSMRLDCINLIPFDLFEKSHVDFTKCFFTEEGLVKVYHNLLNGACSDSSGVLGYLPGSPSALSLS